ncbi:hypothetical protein GGI04_001475 [Coemansia thaxteri]|nr:hypothetical protein GGI04_001475 [Coemansia thaxteri]KAJ2471530.1 hypothetical protein GGI02_002207 [Coemansia sp. RSA 2322]
MLLIGPVVGLPDQSGQHRLARRATPSDLSMVKAGLLVKNGKQTSCALGILDNQASIVSADCLNYKANGQVDMSVIYEAFINAAYDGSPARHAVLNVTIHPSYNPTTKANNVAVIQYNGGSTNAWHNYNAIGPDTWSNIVYSQQYISEIDTLTWATPQVYSQGSADSMCEQLSPLYTANEKDYTCSSGTLSPPSSSLSSCSVPYQMAYGLIGTTLFPAAIFSHVVVQGGSNLCQYSNQRSYYTMMSDYLMFASTVLNRTVYYYSGGNSTQPQQNPGYSMALPTGSSPSSAAVVGGDMYAKQSTGTPTSSSYRMSSSGQQRPTSVVESTSSSAPSDDPSSDGSSSGMSHRTIAIVAACSAVGALLLAVAAFFTVRWWRAHVARTRDPYKEAAAQRMLADGLGGASLPEEHFDALAPPPAYHPEEERRLSAARTPGTTEEIMPLPPSARNEDTYPDEKA